MWDSLFVPLKLVYVVLSIVTILLGAHQKRLMWAVNLVKKTLGVFIYYHRQVYIKASLDFVLILKSIYGWYHWRANKDTPATAPTHLAGRWVVPIALGCALGTLVLGKVYSSYTTTQLPYLDACHAMLVLTAYSLIANKKLEGWICWIVADLVCAYVMFRIDEHLLAVKYSIYVPCTLYGFYQWHKSHHKANK